MQITKAVVPVAGLGTRLLPTTKAIPKEMLPVGRHPIIQHVVEELIDAGITDILFVSSRSKGAIENHFDDYSELMIHLEQGRHEMGQVSRFDYRQRGVQFFFTRQQVPLGQTKPLGTGDAIAAAESFIGNESFVVAFGDSIIYSQRQPSLLTRMVESHKKNDSACSIAVYEIAHELVHHYGIVVPRADANDTTDCRLGDILEKPAPEQTPSRLAISARYIFSSDIFAHIRNVPPAPNGEIYLTDAIAAQIEADLMVRAISLQEGERRYDIGNHRAYFKTFIDYAVADPECGQEMRAYLKQVLEQGP
ncbi:MAG: UTP--glucose-1-phosphate uridylyltransferase [Candidatus Latescibacterota bacterium]|jgi:UTP--glucose-1-phosphate uridylyltransferase